MRVTVCIITIVTMLSIRSSEPILLQLKMYTLWSSVLSPFPLRSKSNNGKHHSIPCFYEMGAFSPLESTFKRHHTVLVFHFLAYFTQHNALHIHPDCSNGTVSFLMPEYYSPVCMYHIFFIHRLKDILTVSISWLLWKVLSSAGVHMGMEVSIWDPDFNSFGYIPRSEIYDPSIMDHMVNF